MSRQPHQAVEIIVDSATPLPQGHQQFLADEAELRTLTENTLKLADQIGYDGPLTLGGAEDHARGQIRRTVTECLELGKTLLIIKELTPHGGFQHRVEQLGLNSRAARSFMQATMKFSKRKLATVLNSVDSQAKLLELLILEPEEIDALERGETARGVALDDIATMTREELRASFRKAREDAAKAIEDKDRYIGGQEKRIQALHKDVSEAERRQSSFTEEEKRDYECAPLHDAINDVMLAAQMMEREVGHLTQEVGGELVNEECFHAVIMFIKRGIEIAEKYRIPLDYASLSLDVSGIELRAAGLTPEALQ